MTTAAPTWPVADYERLPIPAAAFETLAYLIVVAAATLAFVAGWLPVNGAVVLTAVLLASLIVLSWVHLGQGRHPVFLFLCTLTLFQGGRLIAYCMGGDVVPMRVMHMDANFEPARNVQGLALLCVALAAIFVYLPSRCVFRPVAPLDTRSVQRYLPYLYIVFLLSLPVQLYKNIRYFEWAQEHGGYLSIYLSHEALASTVPFAARIVGFLSLPTFLAIFVFERRNFPRYLIASLYFASASVIMAIGARGGAISLLLVAWWVSKVKSPGRRSRVVLLVIFAMVIVFVGDVARRSREDVLEQDAKFSVIDAVAIEGAPLNTTEVAIQYRSYFEPYSGSYLLRELQNAFVGVERSSYHRGMALDWDVSVLLRPNMFVTGAGVAGSYIGEAYIAGGITLVIFVSVIIGFGLAAFYRYGSNPYLLLAFAMSLPEILLMPRAQLLDWVSILIRNGVFFVLLFVGWKVYSLVLSIRHVDNATLERGVIDSASQP